MLPSLSKCFDCIQEVILGLLVSIDDGLLRISRKLCILDDELMQVISQKVGTGISSMAIKHSEKAALWPIGNVFLGRWLHDVEYYAHSIFVVVSYDALISICRIPHNMPVFADTAFSWLPHWEVDSYWVWRWPVTEEKFFNVKGLVVRVIGDHVRLRGSRSVIASWPI